MLMGTIKKRDIIADDMIKNALGEVKAVASYMSEQDAAVQLHDDGTVIVASDPVDGHRILTRCVDWNNIFNSACCWRSLASWQKSNRSWIFSLWAAYHIAGYIWQECYGVSAR